MQEGPAREARRRPDMDLLVGPLEAVEPSDPTERPEDLLDLHAQEAGGADERPTWRDDG